MHAYVEVACMSLLRFLRTPSCI